MVDVALRELKVPPLTAISSKVKVEAASLAVNVNASVVSLVVKPVLTAVPALLAAVMVMVGAVLSTVIVAPLVGAAVIALPAASVPVASANVWVPFPAGAVHE